MATLGSFTTNGNGFEGALETLTLKARLTIEPVEKKNDKTPDYRVFHITGDYRSEVGAAWKKTSRERNAEYLSVTIDDPQFSQQIHCRLVKPGAERTHLLFWDRQRPRD